MNYRYPVAQPSVHRREGVLSPNSSFSRLTDRLLGIIATDSSLSIWRIPLSPEGPSLALSLAWASPSPRGNLEIPGH